MADHEFRIESDSPANKDLMFWRIVGHEAFSRPSSYELTVLSTNRAIDPRAILGRAFDVVIEFLDADEGKHERHAQGHAVRFARGAQIGRFFEYRISLRSWFWLLTKRTNSRILQEKPVLEVLDAVFEDSPIKAVKKIKTDGVTGPHALRRYCVQYQESDYRFLSRILEDEGIYYWFDAHTAPGTMMLADVTDMAHGGLPVKGVLEFVTAGASEARFNQIERWTTARQLQSGKYASRDVDYKAIKRLLSTGADVADNHELADFEVFEYPGGYFNSDDAEAVLAVRADELDTRHEPHWAVTHWPDVAVGHSFTFSGDPDGARDDDYIIAGCTFAATHPGYEGLGPEIAVQPIRRVLQEALLDDAVNSGCLDAFLAMIDTTPALSDSTRGTSTFLITALSAKQAFRPPRLTPRVTMPGPQSAIVVGAKGKELDVDEMGRVKVHFHWDRYDDREEHGEKSTCWIRVSQPWAGKAWGGYFMPRIKQEVIVDFMNGDPDRPIIVGRVYNDDQPIPYKSPTQSGFKTRSTPGGGPSNYNEIMFEDKKGQELVNVHAERNMSTSVEVDDSLSVGRDQSETVDRDRTALVKRNEKNTVAEIQTNVVGISQSNTIGAGGQKTQVKGFQENIFHASQKTSVVGFQALTVTANQNVAIGGFQGTVVGANQDVGVVGFQTTSVGADMAYLVTGNTKMQSGGVRNDVTGGKHAIMANQIKLVSNTSVDIMAVGDINSTSIGSNTTVLGSNSSGYIGSNSEANLGVTRSTFMGLSMSNALAVDIANFAGVQIENTAAIRLSNVATVNLSQNGIDLDLQTMKIISGGGGGGAAASGGTAGMVAGFVIGGAALIRGLFDVKATFDQYQKAKTDLETAAQEARDQGLTNLASRLTRLAAVADRRGTEGGLAMIPIVGGLAMGFDDQFLGGTNASSTADALKTDESSAGARPAAPPAPVIPAVPDMPPLPPPYTPPHGGS
ncbi:type VI secretion system Vgr family protein [Variovorax sp. EL159]|uniref:type VI secretion system Vgr family protein n=1 Tax=Variovorax sp. EL159 TaxID=1566270 RepID=UPI000881C9F6|nr:type VI secretion system tip protein TssI/VgrG [Variovorax sp. EL159]SCX74737.1 type VI secretion system secreted protein VgrG [Variovorax sp. EL159]